MIAIMSNQLVGFLRRLASRAHDLRARELLFQRGDEVRSLFLLETGEAHLVRFQADGGELVLQRAVAGQILAEASVFSDHYHCDAMAVAQTTVLEIDRKRFRDALLASDALADAWNHNLAREVQIARLRAEILSLKTVASRLDAWLSLHAGELPEKGGWKTLAREIGVTPEALYRELAKRNCSRLGRPSR